MRYGLIFDLEYCTGCQSCNIACKQEHGYDAGTFGVRVTEHVYPGKPFVIETQNGADAKTERVQVDFSPFPTTLCDLCARRIASGEDDVPACVRNCQGKCIVYGDSDTLNKTAETMKRPMMFLL